MMVACVSHNNEGKSYHKVYKKELGGVIECFNDLPHNGLCVRSAVSFHSFGICTKVSSGEVTVAWLQLLNKQVIMIQIEMMGK